MNLIEFAKSLKPFMDEMGKTFIEVDLPNSTEQLPLDLPAVKCLVKAMLCSHFPRGYPTEAETKIVLDVIRGQALLEPRREPTKSIDYQIEANTLAQAILAIARSGGTKRTLPEMLSVLTRTAEREGIKLGPTWPRNEDALGKQFSRLKAMMAVKGVILTRHETERPRTWSIALKSAASDASGREVSAVNQAAQAGCSNAVTSDADVATSDVTDAEIIALFNGENV